MLPALQRAVCAEPAQKKRFVEAIMELQHKLAIGFLGYDEDETMLIRHLRSKGNIVTSTAMPVDDLSMFDLVISFGYRHILKQRVIETSKRPILNLHMSYLPYNRGAHPNFWSWIDGTPRGVTIHEIDSGLDTGPIAVQSLANFTSSGMTFRQTYALLFSMLETLFVENCDRILLGDYIPVPQTGQGTSHRTRDLPNWMTSWDIPIDEAVQRFNRSITVP